MRSRLNAIMKYSPSIKSWFFMRLTLLHTLKRDSMLFAAFWESILRV